MQTRNLVVGLLICWAGASEPARAARLSLAHTPWEMHGPERVQVSGLSQTHGDPRSYALAPAIPEPGPDWKALDGAESGPRNPTDIDYLGPSDNYSSDLRTCLTELEVTCFQTFVTLPSSAQQPQGTATLGPLDDGARLLVFTSDHPEGVVPEHGYLEIGETATVDFSKYLKPGEKDRIVVQHLDDCAGQSWLGTVELQVTADLKFGAGRTSWGDIKHAYR